jgi:hypothetical protein
VLGDCRLLPCQLRRGRKIQYRGRRSRLARGGGRRDAESSGIVYERQVKDPGTQTVRMYGEHTAVVTARLRIKGIQSTQPIHFRAWFSDTCVRTPAGRRYVFGQASMPMPAK